MCVGENWPVGDASVSVVSESVAAWWDAPGRRGDGDGYGGGRVFPMGARGGDVGEETLVRHENLSEPGRWYGELGGTGIRGTKTFGGKRGDRSRMYHPHKGRCISHSTAEFALSCR